MRARIAMKARSPRPDADQRRMWILARRRATEREAGHDRLAVGGRDDARGEVEGAALGDGPDAAVARDAHDAIEPVRRDEDVARPVDRDPVRAAEPRAIGAREQLGLTRFAAREDRDANELCLVVVRDD